MTCQGCRAHSNFMITQAKIITLITYPISSPLCISSLLFLRKIDKMAFEGCLMCQGHLKYIPLKWERDLVLF